MEAPDWLVRLLGDNESERDLFFMNSKFLPCCEMILGEPLGGKRRLPMLRFFVSGQGCLVASLLESGCGMVQTGESE